MESRQLKPIISKTPDVPDLSEEALTCLTAITFGTAQAPRPCDALFVFGGTHPGHWEKAIEAYQKGYAKQIIVTGGRSLTGTPHDSWRADHLSEAEVIIRALLAAGVPETAIRFENRSTNTLENVLFAKEVFDFDSISSLMFVCKSHVTGRQGRTLAKHLPEHLTYVPFTFDATYQGIALSRDQWMASAIGRSRIWGEYLRINHYGQKGDCLALRPDEEFL